VSPRAAVKAGKLRADDYTGEARNHREGNMATEFSPELLRAARTLAGLTGEELATRAGLHPVTLRNYERGMHCPADTWAKIEKALRGAMDEHGRAVEKMRKRLAA
jgi:ribosome-binding protein aMBF1 (putative translation factor)